MKTNPDGRTRIVFESRSSTLLDECWWCLKPLKQLYPEALKQMCDECEKFIEKNWSP